MANKKGICQSITRQAMESKNYFGNYTLSESTIVKLQEIAKSLERDENPAKSAWTIVKPKQETRPDKSEDVRPPSTQQENPELTEVDKANSIPSTQFFFSQLERPPNPPINDKPLGSSWRDVAESLYESLENTNETLSLVDLTKLSDAEVDNVVKFLSTKLSLKATYNLCHSVCAMNIDESAVYIKIICSNLLLEKIIDLQKPSRLMRSLIQELVEKFPEDIQEFLYIPMLNSDLGDTSAFLTILSSFPQQRRIDCISNFLTSVQELREWHVNILSHLMTVKLTDDAMKDKLLKLLLDKSSTYSQDKNYGKFILSFLKLSPPFTEDQRGSLSEIVAVNQTIFKRVMENLLQNMYFHGNLWHMS